MDWECRCIYLPVNRDHTIAISVFVSQAKVLNGGAKTIWKEQMKLVPYSHSIIVRNGIPKNSKLAYTYLENFQ